MKVSSISKNHLCKEKDNSQYHKYILIQISANFLLLMIQFNLRRIERRPTNKVINNSNLTTQQQPISKHEKRGN
jgi:hypothetical protein